MLEVGEEVAEEAREAQSSEGRAQRDGET